MDFAVPDDLLTDADWKRLEQMGMLWLVQEHTSELQALTALNLSGLGLTEVRSRAVSAQRTSAAEP